MENHDAQYDHRGCVQGRGAMRVSSSRTLGMLKKKNTTLPAVRALVEEGAGHACGSHCLK